MLEANAMPENKETQEREATSVNFATITRHVFSSNYLLKKRQNLKLLIGSG